MHTKKNRLKKQSNIIQVMKNNKNQRMPKKELRTMLIGETQKKGLKCFIKRLKQEIIYVYCISYIKVSM